MFFHGHRRHAGRVFEPITLAGVGVLILAISGCNERDRLTFPVNDGQGPQATITDPSQDTTVTAGPFALVGGRVIDLDGVDTVYFEVVGGASTFPPFFAGGDDSVSYSFSLVTSGLGGVTMTVMVYGTDVGGVRGDTAIRQVTVQ